VEMTKAGFDWSSANQGTLFKVRVSEDTLVISLPRPSPVISWAAVHGGLRTLAAHIIEHRFAETFDFEDSARMIRRAASRAGIQGSFVGMITAADIRNHSIKTSTYQEFRVWVLSTAGCKTLSTVGQPGNTVEGRPSVVEAAAINVVVAVNYHSTQEAMPEALAIATEAKVKAMHELGLRSHLAVAATGANMDCVAIACGHDRRYHFSGKHTKWGELIGGAALESIKEAIKIAVSAQS
jgi:iron complex transport system ATP-binding protein